MLTIPEIRDRLYSVADKIEDPELANEIRYLAGQTYRRRYTRTRAKSTPMSPELREKIVQTYENNPDWSFQDIAVHCNCNLGRVSETINGER